MGNFKDILSRYGFATLLFILGVIVLSLAVSNQQNSTVIISIVAIISSAILIALNNSGILPLKLVSVVVAVLVIASLGFAWMNYDSIQDKLDFIKIQEKREAKVVERLIDIRSAQASYKKLYGKYAGNFDDLINHVKNDSMPVIKAIGFVPDTLTEAKAVELGIVTRDTLLISVRDTLFPANYHIDSLRYIPNSGDQEFRLESGEIEKNKLTVQVFEAFASNEKILHGLDLSEEYIELDKGLSVGSMIDPHTRGNWE